MYLPSCVFVYRYLCANGFDEKDEGEKNNNKRTYHNQQQQH